MFRRWRTSSSKAPKPPSPVSISTRLRRAMCWTVCRRRTRISSRSAWWIWERSKSIDKSLEERSAMPISSDDRFTFDVKGYLHLRGALSAAKVAEYTRWMSDVDKIDVKAFNHDRLPLLDKHLNRPVSRVIDADPR